MPEKDKNFITYLSSILKNSNNDNIPDDSNIKDLIIAFASWAGKGKDEVVQILCREIGVATAAMFKEPISQILENRKLQITFEFVPKDPKKNVKTTSASKKSPAKNRKKSKSKPSRKKRQPSAT